MSRTLHCSDMNYDVLTVQTPGRAEGGTGERGGAGQVPAGVSHRGERGHQDGHQGRGG